MASVRAQNLAAVFAKLEAVRLAINWTSCLRNPRDTIGVDQMNAIVMMDGGDREPASLTGHVSDNELEFSVGFIVAEKARASAGETAEELLDIGFVAVSNALLDPNDIQLGGLAVGIFRGAISDPIYGRPDKGAQWFGGQWVDFRIQYFEREGDAEQVGP